MDSEVKIFQGQISGKGEGGLSILTLGNEVVVLVDDMR